MALMRQRIQLHISSSQVVLDEGADITFGAGEPVSCNALSVPARLRGWLERLRDGGRDARAIRGVQEALRRRRFLEPVVRKLPVISAMPLIWTPSRLSVKTWPSVMLAPKMPFIM